MRIITSSSCLSGMYVIITEPYKIYTYTSYRSTVTGNTKIDFKKIKIFFFLLQTNVFQKSFLKKITLCAQMGKGVNMD